MTILFLVKILIIKIPFFGLSVQQKCQGQNKSSNFGPWNVQWIE